jgi:hypothetical protein
MIFNKECLANVQEELEPLLKEHYKEVAMYTDRIDLNVDWDKYYMLESIGALVIYTMREDEGKLVGYNVFFVNNHLHYNDHKYAVNDVVYIDPAYRHNQNTLDLFIRAEDDLRDSGVSVMTYHMKVYKTFECLMGVLEYDHAEHVYTKFIG